MSKIKWDDILKEMFTTKQNYKLNNDYSVVHTYKPESANAEKEDYKKLDVQLHINGLEFRYLYNNLTCVAYLKTMKEGVEYINAILIIDSLIEGHGITMINYDELVKSLKINSDPEISRMKTKAEILDDILGRIEIKKS